MIAEEYKEHVIESKWMQLIKKYTRPQSVKLNFIEKCSNMKVKHPKDYWLEYERKMLENINETTGLQTGVSMKTHITTLNNMAGTASLAHRRVLKVAQSIGCHEMGLSFYPLKPDYAKEIDKRLDGIIAPLNYGDIVIFSIQAGLG